MHLKRQQIIESFATETTLKIMLNLNPLHNFQIQINLVILGNGEKQARLVDKMAAGSEDKHLLSEMHV